MAKLTLREKAIMAQKAEEKALESKEVRSEGRVGLVLVGKEFDELFFDQTFYRACRDAGIAREVAEKEWGRLVSVGLVEWEKKVGGVEAFRRAVKKEKA